MRALADRDYPILLAFAEADDRGAALEVDIGDAQCSELGAADPGGVEHLHHGAITDAEQIGEVGDREHLLDLLLTEDRAR